MREENYLHYKDQAGGFYTFCDRKISEVQHWTYYGLKDLDGLKDIPVCPECEKWSNLHALAKAKL